MSATQTNDVFPVLCIPRAMLFHTSEFVENAINHAMGGKFVKTMSQSTTTDKSGTQFNVFFIHPDQDFKPNRNTDTLYKNLKNDGIVNISTGSGKYFWKVKLYVPYLKAKYLPKTETEVPVPVGPRILSMADLAEFRQWQKEKAEKNAKKETDEEIRQRLGNRLYPLVVNIREFEGFTPEKITGMILEMPSDEVEKLISDPLGLLETVIECVRVLNEAQSSA